MPNNSKLPPVSDWPDEDIDWRAVRRNWVQWQARAIKAAHARGRNDGYSVFPLCFETREEWIQFRAQERHMLEVMQEAAKRAFYPHERPSYCGDMPPLGELLR